MCSVDILLQDSSLALHQDARTGWPIMWGSNKCFRVVSSGFEGGVSSKLSGSNQWFRVVSSGFEGGVSSELSGSDFPTEQLVLFALHGFIVIP